MPVLFFNSPPPSAAYMRQLTGSTLVQVVACGLCGAKPLYKRMQAYFYLKSWEHVSVTFESEFFRFHSRKCIWKCRQSEWRPFFPGWWVNKSLMLPVFWYVKHVAVNRYQPQSKVPSHCELISILMAYSVHMFLTVNRSRPLDQTCCFVFSLV